MTGPEQLHYMINLTKAQEGCMPGLSDEPHTSLTQEIGVCVLCETKLQQCFPKM